jgi:hypothetical protein
MGEGVHAAGRMAGGSGGVLDYLGLGPAVMADLARGGYVVNALTDPVRR